MSIPPGVLELAQRPALRPLWAELARRLGTSDRPVRSIQLRGLEPAARAALAEMLASDRLPDADTTVRVDHLAQVLGVDDDGLRIIVERFYGPLGNRSAERARAAADRDALWADVLEQVGGRALGAWVERLRRIGIPDGDLGTYRRQLSAALRVISELPLDSPEPLPLLAARTIGDPHALDAGTWVAGAVLDAVATEHGLAPATNAESQRRLWSRAGVLCDRLSTPVLTSGLRCRGDSPLASILAASADAAEPVPITASQLQRWPIDPQQRTVWVVENPSIVEAARLAGVQAPLVCTASWPTEAAVLLLDQLRVGGTELRYHSDLDPTGVVLTSHLVERFGVRPWRMTAADYLAAAPASRSSREATSGLPPTPWDPELREAMARHGHVVFEEDVIGVLLDDLGV